MSSKMDISISTAEAAAWTKKVQAEFKEVSAVLKKVGAVCDDFEKKDDTVYIVMKATMDQYTAAWNNLEKGYDTVMEKIANIIRHHEKAVEENKQKVKTYAKKKKS